MRIPYVAVDEARRACLAGGDSLKNLDFIIASRPRGGWLVDVKGRRFPSGRLRPQYWKNWSPSEDLHSLAQWEQLFGPGFQGMLVFAYWILGTRSPVGPEEEFNFDGQRFVFLAVSLADYCRWARPLSLRWGTVMIPSRIFRELARPFVRLFDDPDRHPPVEVAGVAETV
jgi:hypothetical protein